MEPEERLDALLSRRQTTGARPARDLTPPAQEEDAHLGALLDAADQFAIWGVSDPPPAFANRLEADLLAQFSNGAAHGADAGADNSASSRASQALRATRRAGARRDVKEPAMGSGARLVWRRMPRLAKQFVAAALVVIVGAGALLAAAANASPGQPLSGLRGWERGMLSELSNDADRRVRVHLQNAQQALDAFDTAVAQHDGAPGVNAALATFTQQEQAAAAGVAALPAGDERDALAAQLAALRDRAQHDLRSALIGLNWATRAEVTAVLRTLGEAAPWVTQATITGTTIDGNYIWIITINGADFSPSALLLIDGQPTGTIVSQSPTTLDARIPGNLLSAGAHTIGVGNPDDTASIVSSMTSAAQDDHGGSSDGGGGHDGSGSGRGS